MAKELEIFQGDSLDEKIAEIGDRLVTEVERMQKAIPEKEAMGEEILPVDRCANLGRFTPSDPEDKQILEELGRRLGVETGEIKTSDLYYGQGRSMHTRFGKVIIEADVVIPRDPDDMFKPRQIELTMIFPKAVVKELVPESLRLTTPKAA